MTRKVFAALCGLIMSLTLSVGFVSVQSPTPALAYTSADTGAYPVLRQGSSGYQVTVLQYLLRHRGYTLAVDGAFGSGTASSVRGFQSANGLSADGIVGPATWSRLILTVRQGDSGNQVRAVQSGARGQGQSITVDGVFGSGTAQAVRTIQSSRGLAADAVVGAQTWGALLGVRGSTGTTSPGPDTRYPYPQTAGYSNGYLPSSVLCQVPGAASGYRIACRALPDFTAMSNAYRATFGRLLQVDHVSPSSINCYRTYAQQVVLWNAYQNGTGNKAAVPGTSNHGWGMACDINMVRNGGAYYTSPTYYWLRDNAAGYGFSNDVSGEDWHWTYKR